jgi:hypothetical protein
MESQTSALRVYRELADRYEARGEESLRDRYLVLAADAAWTAGQYDEAERLRQRLLARNRNHLLKPYASFAQALRSPDVKLFISELRRSCPPEAARQLLDSLRGEGDTGGSGDLDRTLRPPSRPVEKPAERAAEKPVEKQPFPPTAPVINVDQDNTWVPTAGGELRQRPPEPAAPEPGFDLEQTAQLSPDMLRPPEALDDTLHEPPPPRTPTRPSPAPRPAAGPRPDPSAERPAPRPAPAPTRPIPEAPARRVPAPAHLSQPAEPLPEAHAGGWLATLLGVLVLLLGVALGGLALARPFVSLPGLP